MKLLIKFFYFFVCYIVLDVIPILYTSDKIDSILGNWSAIVWICLGLFTAFVSDALYTLNNKEEKKE